MSHNSGQSTTKSYAIDTLISFRDDGTFKAKFHFKTPKPEELPMDKVWSFWASIKHCIPQSHADNNPQAIVRGSSEVAKKSFEEKLAPTLSEIQNPGGKFAGWTINNCSSSAEFHKVCPSSATTFPTLPSFPFVAVAPDFQASRSQFSWRPIFVTQPGPDQVLLEQDRRKIKTRLGTISADKMQVLSHFGSQSSHIHTTVPLIFGKHFTDAIKEINTSHGKWTPSIHDDQRMIWDLESFLPVASQVEVYSS